MLYLANDEGLARDLNTGALPESDKFVYLLLFILGYSAVYFIFHLLSHFEMGRQLGIVRVVATLLMLFVLYRKNRSGDDKNFIERYVCLSVPCYFNSAVIFFLSAAMCAMPILVMNGFTSLPSIDGSEPLPYAGMCIIMVSCTFYFWWRMYKSFLIASARQTENPSHG